MALLDQLSLVAARILEKAAGAVWWNFQENGNWSANVPQKSHCHLHIYGRSERSRRQQFGEALVLPLKDEAGQWGVAGYSQEFVETLRGFASTFANEMGIA
jgi:hypothetical protein